MYINRTSGTWLQILVMHFVSTVEDWPVQAGMVGGSRHQDVCRFDPAFAVFTFASCPTMWLTCCWRPFTKETSGIQDPGWSEDPWTVEVRHFADWNQSVGAIQLGWPLDELFQVLAAFSISQQIARCSIHRLSPIAADSWGCCTKHGRMNLGHVETTLESVQPEEQHGFKMCQEYI